MLDTLKHIWVDWCRRAFRSPAPFKSELDAAFEELSRSTTKSFIIEYQMQSFGNNKVRVWIYETGSVVGSDIEEVLTRAKALLVAKG